MNRITVIAFAAVWLSSPVQCFADNTSAGNTDSVGLSARSRNATLTPKTRLVGIDNPCHRRKLKLTARISSTETGTLKNEAKVGCPTQPTETSEEYFPKYTIWAGP